MIEIVPQAVAQIAGESSEPCRLGERDRQGCWGIRDD